MSRNDEVIERNILENKYAVFDKLIEGAQVISPDWEYIYVNDTVVRHGKTTHNELCGSSMLEKYPGIEKTEMFSRLKSCMHERSSDKMFNEFIFPNGTKGWFELSMQPVEEGVLILSHDITDQKRIEEKLAKQLDERIALTTRLKSQNKQLEDFCYIISHNFRAPISNLFLLHDMILETENDTERKSFLQSQKKVLLGLNRLTENLYEIVQIRKNYELQRTKINLEESVRHAMNMLNGDILESGASVKYDFEKAREVWFPKDYMDSLMINLLGNALKYRSPNRKPEIELCSYVKNKWIHVEISDNGLGIDLEKHGEKIFRLHKTFHDHPKAKGFGLFLTKTLLEVTGGDIWVKSAPDIGTTFTMKLCKPDKNGGN